MIYDQLADFYDALVKDDIATNEWIHLVKKNIKGKHILELACGSGETAIGLAQEGYQIDASDSSEQMLKKAKEKQGSQAVHWFLMNMCTFDIHKDYDGVLCLCDSMNYLLKEEQLFQVFSNVYNCLKSDGVFIMDMHSMDRLEEFQQEYIEEGIVEGYEYEWCIYSIDDYIYQNFAFYDEFAKPRIEQHVQKVYSPTKVEQMLRQIGFHVQIFTDFVLEGIHPGEKYFYICRKEVEL